MTVNLVNSYSISCSIVYQICSLILIECNKYFSQNDASLQSAIVAEPDTFIAKQEEPAFNDGEYPLICINNYGKRSCIYRGALELGP